MSDIVNWLRHPPKYPKNDLEAMTWLPRLKEAADRIEALEALLETAHPMLDRLAHYEGTINQPSAELAEQIRTVLDASLKSPISDGGEIG